MDAGSCKKTYDIHPSSLDLERLRLHAFAQSPVEKRRRRETRATRTRHATSEKAAREMFARKQVYRELCARARVEQTSAEAVVVAARRNGAASANTAYTKMYSYRIKFTTGAVNPHSSYLVGGTPPNPLCCKPTPSRIYSLVPLSRKIARRTIEYTILYLTI